MADWLGTYPHFRLNFEQQGKRAKDLLKAAREGEPAARARFKATPKLAEAQYLIARELRFDNWAALKQHIALMTRERATMQRDDAVLDGDLPTLHIRCGSDLRTPLREAGFHGDFHEHSYPYLIGPVRDGGPGCLEERARFLVDSYGESHDPPLFYEPVLDGLRRDEQVLQDSAACARVVIWSEGDCYDQLVLVRLLAHFAVHQRPQHLELINLRDFPGGLRFIGLGQLPPEALRMLWPTRVPVSPAILQLGLAAWRALASVDPRTLAVIMRSGTPELPLLAPALHRHLRELPSASNGLSLTQQMALEVLATGERSLFRMFGAMNYHLDPLPGQGDSQMRDRVLAMEQCSEPLFTRRPGVGLDGNTRPPWTDVLTITAAGCAVLAGERDFQSMRPPPRWVGGVRIGPDLPDWRWDESRREPILNAVAWLPPAARDPQ
jgi:hypothetical protein